MSRKVSISSLTLSEPMTKPARVQVNPEDIDDLDKTQQVNNHQYNIWYSKSLSDANNKSTTKLKYRVRISTDQGFTKANKNTHICLFFSRGCCYLGSKCQYFHRLPKNLTILNQHKIVLVEIKLPTIEMTWMVWDH